MAKTFINGNADLPNWLDKELPPSDWVEITQERINMFAEATGDHQWIHVDVEKARAGPFGAPIAHGFLTLSLLPRFFESALAITESTMGVNYGLNKVRFMAPVAAGSRLRARLTLVSSDPIDNNGLQLVWDVAVEKEGSAKPVCVAQSVVRRYP